MTALWRSLSTVLLLAAVALAAALWRPAAAPADQDAPKEDGAPAARQPGDDRDDRDHRDARDDRDDPGDREGRDGRDDRRRRGPDDADRSRDGRGPTRGPWVGPEGEAPPFPGTDEALQKALTVFKDLNPYMARRLEEDLKENPDRAKGHIERMWGFLHPYIVLSEDDPELYKHKTAETRTWMAARYFAFRYHRAMRGGDDQKAAAEEARKSLEEQARLHFEARMAIRELELTRLKSQVEAMDQKLTEMRKEKDKHIEEQIARLLNPPQRSGPPGPPRGGDRSEPTNADR